MENLFVSVIKLRSGIWIQRPSLLVSDCFCLSGSWLMPIHIAWDNHLVVNLAKFITRVLSQGEARFGVGCGLGVGGWGPPLKGDMWLLQWHSDVWWRAGVLLLFTYSVKSSCCVFGKLKNWPWCDPDQLTLMNWRGLSLLMTLKRSNLSCIIRCFCFWKDDKNQQYIG